MTYEEALRIFKDNCFGCSFKDKYCKDCKTHIAIEAITKQIPMKPLHEHKNYYCPICKEGGWILWDDAVPNDMDNYCGKCGQAIDWSDIND